MTSNAANSMENYHPCFDWLRLGLALVVLLSHEGMIDAWPQAANFAVQILFALSGWLIGGVLVTLPKDGLCRFYYDRAVKIWCPYYLALGLLVVQPACCAATPLINGQNLSSIKPLFLQCLWALWIGLILYLRPTPAPLNAGTRVRAVETVFRSAGPACTFPCSRTASLR